MDGSEICHLHAEGRYLTHLDDDTYVWRSRRPPQYRIVLKTHAVTKIIEWLVHFWRLVKRPLLPKILLVSGQKTTPPACFPSASVVDLSPIWVPIEVCRRHADHPRCRRFLPVHGFSHGYPFFAVISTFAPSYDMGVIMYRCFVLGVRGVAMAASILKQHEGSNP